MASVPPTAPPAPPLAPGPGPEPVGEEFPRWPLWAPLLAVAIGLLAALVITGIVGAGLQAADPSIDERSPWLNAIGTLLLDLCVIAAVFGVASLTTRPRLWQFGLRQAPAARAIGLAVAAVAAFYAFALTYGVIFDPKNPQKIVDDLGADQSTALLVSGAVVVIVFAPVAEEILFRGFLFRVLRVRTGFWVAAVITGAIFGLIHGYFVIFPILAFLGVALCWVYERTGSIFPCIAIHALNNTLSYGYTTDDGWVAAGAVGAVMIVACALVPAALGRGSPTPAPAGAA